MPLERSFLRRLPGRIINPIDDRAGRLFYGNMTKLSNNVIGQYRWNKNKSLYKESPQMCPEVAKIRKMGIGTFRPGFDPNVLESLYGDYLNIIEDPKYTIFLGKNGISEVTNLKETYRFQVRKPIETLPQIKKLVNNAFEDYLFQYYQSHFCFHSAEIWRNIHYPEDEISYLNHPYSLHWHVDFHPVDTLKIFIALSDITEEDGPLHFTDIPNTQRLRKMGYKNRFNYNVPIEALENHSAVYKLTGSLGTSAFCNTTQCLHRAGIPKPGHTRDLLQLRFQSSNTPFSWD